MEKLRHAVFTVMLGVVLALAMTVMPPAAVGYAAGAPGEIAEVAAELHPPNEVTRELNPDMFSAPDTMGIYGAGTQDAGRPQGTVGGSRRAAH